MYIYYIGFEDKSKEGEEYLTYLGLYISGGKLNPNETYKESTGDFIKDWFNTIKKLNDLGENRIFPMYTISSQINHLEDYNFNFETAFLHVEDGNYVLKYLDRTKEYWWEDKISEGIEFFVPDNTWTWEQLNEYCKKS